MTFQIYKLYQRWLGLGPQGINGWSCEEGTHGWWMERRLYLYTHTHIDIPDMQNNYVWIIINAPWGAGKWSQEEGVEGAHGYIHTNILKSSLIWDDIILILSTASCSRELSTGEGGQPWQKGLQTYLPLHDLFAFSRSRTPPPTLSLCLLMQSMGGLPSTYPSTLFASNCQEIYVQRKQSTRSSYYARDSWSWSDFKPVFEIREGLVWVWPHQFCFQTDENLLPKGP